MNSRVIRYGASSFATVGSDMALMMRRRRQPDAREGEVRPGIAGNCARTWENLLLT